MRAAGFEIADMMMWMFAEAMVKNHNLSKAIDKLGRIVVDECDGHDDFNDAYRNELLAVYTELLRNRRRLNP